MTDPETRIAVMEDSLRCFQLGWLSLVPLVGLVAAVAAMRAFGRARRATTGSGNPARAYLRAGIWLARLGMVVSVAVLGVLGVVLAAEIS